MVRNIDYDSLPQLQNIMKKTPSLYLEEFEKQMNRFDSLLSLYRHDSNNLKQLEEALMFLSNVVYLYPKHVDDFCEKLLNLIEENQTSDNFAFVKTLVQAFILFKNKTKSKDFNLIKTSLVLLRNESKEVRNNMFNHLLTCIKDENFKSKNAKYNKNMQEYLSQKIFKTDLNDVENFRMVSKCVQILTTLYRKQIWNDDNTVNTLTNVCLLQNGKVSTTAAQFFLNSEDTKEKEEPEEDLNLVRERHRHKVKAKTNSSKRKLEMVMKKLKKTAKKDTETNQLKQDHMTVYYQIYDPYDFTEKLFKKVIKNKQKFEERIIFLKLISRIISVHKLIFLDFYPCLYKYLKPHQDQITKFLVIASQSSHDLAPPDVIEGLIRTIASNFILESLSPEVIAVGLNTVREIVSRCPLVLEESMVSDYAGYISYKNKTVTMAARAFIQLVKKFNPKLLQRSLRKESAKNPIKHKEVLPYGQTEYTDLADLADSTLQKNTDLPEDQENEPELVDADTDAHSDSEAEGTSENEELDSDNEESHEEDCAEAFDQENASGTTKVSTKASVSSDNSSSEDNDGFIEDKHVTKFVNTAGAEEKEKYKHVHRQKSEHKSTTNKQKLKTKPIKMRIHNKQNMKRKSLGFLEKKKLSQSKRRKYKK